MFATVNPIKSLITRFINSPCSFEEKNKVEKHIQSHQSNATHENTVDMQKYRMTETGKKLLNNNLDDHCDATVQRRRQK